jgi:hypothetical protein
MAIYDPRHEVAWRLWQDDDEGDVMDVRDKAGGASRENYESLARFAGLLAGAEVAAITLCRGEGLIIELTDPPSPWLTPGAFMRAQSSNSADDGWSVGSFLAGSLRWSWCKPPAGFCSAALIGGPLLVASQRLLLVANREGRLSEVNLGLAASYLAQARRPASGPKTGKGHRAAGEAACAPESDAPFGHRTGLPGSGTTSTGGTEGAPPAQGEAAS